MSNAQALAEALWELLHAVCSDTGFASSVRNDTQRAYPWPAMDIAEDKARAALAAYDAAPAPVGSNDAETLSKALRSYRQADMDGIMVLVSRQACDEAADMLAALAPASSDDSRIDEAVLAEKMRMMEWCAKRQKIARLNWERAARKALAGDMSELRTRIDLIDAGPLDVVLSGEREQP